MARPGLGWLLLAGCCCSLGAAQNCAADDGDVYIGGMFDYRLGDNADRLHFEHAVWRLNEESDGWHDDVLPGATVAADTRDSGCNPSAAVRKMWELGHSWGRPLHAVIGPRCSGAAMRTAEIAELQGIPLLSGRSSSPALSDAARYPNFFRTTGPDGRQGKTIRALLRYWGWSKVGVIATDTDYARGLVELFKEEWLGSHGNWVGSIPVDCVVMRNQDTTASQGSMEQCFQKIWRLPPHQRPRVILLAAHGHNAAEIVQKSTDSGRDTGRIWIGTDAWTGWSEIEQTGTEALVMGLTPATNDDAPENAEYLAKFNEWYDMQLLQGGIPVAEWPDHITELCTYCGETVDAVVAMGKALHAAREEGGDEAMKDGARVMAHLRNVSFAGVSGEISFDDSGDRKISSFTIKTLNRPTSTNPACCDGSSIVAGPGATQNARGRLNRLACASGANDFCCVDPEDDTVGPLYCTTDGAAHAAAEGTIECPEQDSDEFHLACPDGRNPTWQTWGTLTATTVSADGGNSTGPPPPAPPWFDGTEVPFDFVEVSEVGCKEGSDCIGSRHGPYCYKDGGCDHLECLGECRWDTGDIKCGTAMSQGARPHPPLHVAVFRCLLRTRDLCCASHLQPNAHANPGSLA